MWFCPNVCNLLYFRYQTSISVYVIPVVYGMIGIARTGSVYLTMSVTLERYFAIVRPLASFRIKRCLIPISITFAGLYNIPRFFELERYNFTYTNETLVRATKLRENPIYVSIYNTWMKMVSLKFLKDFSPHLAITFFVSLQPQCHINTHWGKNPHFIQKFTCLKSHDSRNSHVQNHILSRIHISKITFIEKKSHF